MDQERVEKLLPYVSEIARMAGNQLLPHGAKVAKTATTRMETPNRKEFVTNADRLSHNSICSALRAIVPDIGIYSEEGDSKLEEMSEWKWVVDPLDGTINYFHRFPEWGVSIALVKKAQTVLAVNYFPEMNICISTSLEASIKKAVRQDRDLAEAQIWTDHIKGSADAVMKVFDKLTRHTRCPQIRLCCTASMMAVATGKIAGYVHPAPKPEDFAAAALIVEKAGGKVTDIQGNPWNVFSKSIVATNGLLHDPLLEILNS